MIIPKALDQRFELLDERIVVFAPPPFAFFEVEIEVLSDAVELGQSTLCEGPETLDPIDMHAVLAEGLGPGLLDPQMAIVADIDEPVLGPPAI